MKRFSCTVSKKNILESWLNIFLTKFLRWKTFWVEKNSQITSLSIQKFRRFQWKVSSSIETEIPFCITSQKTQTTLVHLTLDFGRMRKNKPFQRWGPGIRKVQEYSNKAAVLVTQTYELLHGLPNGRQYFGNTPLPHTPTRSKSTGKKESVKEFEANQEKPLSEPRISSLLAYTVLTLNKINSWNACKSGSVNKASPTHGSDAMGDF